VFWVISVYFNIRNTLPKFCPLLLGHPVYQNACKSHLEINFICLSNYLLSITDKMQHYTIFCITVSAVRVSDSFSAHHQELKNCTHSIWCMSSLLAATTSSSSKQASRIHDAVCTVFEVLMVGGENARNTYSTDSNTEYCITLHLIGYTQKIH